MMEFIRWVDTTNFQGGGRRKVQTAHAVVWSCKDRTVCGRSTDGMAPIPPLQEFDGWDPPRAGGYSSPCAKCEEAIEQ